MIMLQIVDISDSIIGQQQKNKIDQLELLNACVSHELRNPLNSIKARNMEKSYLYNRVISLMKEPNIDVSTLISALNPIIQKLIKGKKV
jgi:signal transduction histidine kinase